MPRPNRKNAPLEIKSLARTHTNRAIAVLAGLMDQPDVPAAARVAAAQALIDRGWGKAPIMGPGDQGDHKLTIAWENGE
jgi:hypothetical protein